ETRKRLLAVDLGVAAGINLQHVVARGIVISSLVVGGRPAALLVTEITQIGEQVVHSSRRSFANGERRGVNSRRAHEDVASQTGVDDRAVTVVIIEGRSDHDQPDDQQWGYDDP